MAHFPLSNSQEITVFGIMQSVTATTSVSQLLKDENTEKLYKVMLPFNNVHPVLITDSPSFGWKIYLHQTVAACVSIIFTTSLTLWYYWG